MLDEYELSAPIFIWEPLLYNDRKAIILDIYYCENGFPKEIHDNYGNEEVERFRSELIKVIKENNNCDSVWRISSDAFAILYQETNHNNFSFSYKSLEYNIYRKTFKIAEIDKSI